VQRLAPGQVGRWRRERLDQREHQRDQDDGGQQHQRGVLADEAHGLAGGRLPELGRGGDALGSPGVERVLGRHDDVS
jgi:hypothetical protein